VISGRKAGALVRSFFAVALPPQAREACAALAEQLRARPDGEGVRWVAPASYHLTLRFLGNVEVEALAELVARVSAGVVETAPFAFRLRAVGAFPTPARPRVIAVAAEPEEPLRALAQRVEDGVVAAGLAPERRGFHAHLTLGRVRSRRHPALSGAEVPGAPEVPVREIVLYRSDLGHGGPTYTSLHVIALAGPAREAGIHSP
jgi:2'-5' RNA ligase